MRLTKESAMTHTHLVFLLALFPAAVLGFAMPLCEPLYLLFLVIGFFLAWVTGAAMSAERQAMGLNRTGVVASLLVAMGGPLLVFATLLVPSHQTGLTALRVLFVLIYFFGTWLLSGQKLRLTVLFVFFVETVGFLQGWSWSARASYPWKHVNWEVVGLTVVVYPWLAILLSLLVRFLVLGEGQKASESDCSFESD